MDLVFYTMLDAACNILTWVHYKSMKCDVSFSPDSVQVRYLGEADLDIFVMYV